MKQSLILFTAEYPFGSGETFLETEIKFLSEGFDKVIIVSQSDRANHSRTVPANCEVRRINLSISRSQKLSALKNVFNPIFWKEKRIIQTVYNQKFSKGIFSTMLISLYRAKKLKKYCNKLCNEEGATSKLVFYSYWCDDVALGLALLQKNHDEITCFSRMHGWDVYFEASSLNYLPYRHFIAENLKALYAISEKGKEYTAESWKISNPEKVKVSRLGVSEQNPVVSNSEEFILVSCSNVIPLKRVDLIVRSLAELKDVPLKWVHFGDGPELEKVKLLALNLLPEKIVADFKGRVGNKEILEWYAENNPNLFINVSTTEGIPVSIMEAMSFGIPVIATNVGGTSEIVNEVNGVLLKPNPSIQEVSDAVHFFVNLNEENKSKFRLATKSKWESDFNAENNYKTFCASIQAL